MKTCSLCKIEKDLDLFSFRSDRKDVKNSWCKECVNEYNRSKKYYKNKKERIIIVSEKKCNICKLVKSSDEFYKNNRNETGLRSSCKECDRLLSKKYNENNKEKIKDRNNNYYLENIDYHKDRNKKYRDENKKKYSEYNKIYKSKRILEDENFRFIALFRKKINSFMKGYKDRKTEEILGCSFTEFKEYIEDKFEDWMTWDNYGKYNGDFGFGWDLDHIIPLSSANGIDELIKLNHYTNIQPLCSKVNRYVKRNRVN